jgi:long-chain acyl-CoA synthetase
MYSDNLINHGDNTCLILDDYEFTYKEVDRECNNICKFLGKTKKLVLLKAGTNIETVICYLALLKSNHAMIMVDSSINNTHISRFIDKYQPNYLWEPIQDDSESEYVLKFKNYGLKCTNNYLIDLHPKLSLMLSTSGSTGSPKLVRLSKDNLSSNTDSINDYLRISSLDVAISNLPFHYSYGLSIINTHIDKGASVVITEKSPMTKDFWNLFEKHNVTNLNGVPYNYEIFKRIGIDNMSLDSLRFITQAGGKLNETLIKSFTDFANTRNIDFYIMYGQTEATARISYLPPKDLNSKINSIGKPIKNGELVIKDLNGKYELESAKEGELIYKGKNVMMGYASTIDDLKKGNDLDGILPTGDIAYKDDDGYFYITGRIKRFIKIHGNRISLDEVENNLKSALYEVACVGIDNMLFVATTEYEKIHDIKKYVKENFALHHSTFSVTAVEKFPSNSSGKIKYNELLNQLL